MIRSNFYEPRLGGGDLTHNLILYLQFVQVSLSAPRLRGAVEDEGDEDEGVVGQRGQALDQEPGGDILHPPYEHRHEY